MLYWPFRYGYTQHHPRVMVSTQTLWSTLHPHPCKDGQVRTRIPPYLQPVAVQLFMLHLENQSKFLPTSSAF